MNQNQKENSMKNLFMIFRSFFIVFCFFAGISSKAYASSNLRQYGLRSLLSLLQSNLGSNVIKNTLHLMMERDEIQWPQGVEPQIRYYLKTLVACEVYKINSVKKNQKIFVPKTTLEPLEMNPGLFGIQNLWGPASIPIEERNPATEETLALYNAVKNTLEDNTWDNSFFNNNFHELDTMIQSTCIGDNHLPRLSPRQFNGLTFTESMSEPLWDLGDLATKGPFSLLVEWDDQHKLFKIETDTDASTDGIPLRNTVWFHKNDQDHQMRVVRIDSEFLGVNLLPIHPQFNLLANIVLDSWTTSVTWNEHLIYNHFFGGLYGAAAVRLLGTTHPLYKLMLPHVQGSIGVQMQQTSLLFGEEGLLLRPGMTPDMLVNEFVKDIYKMDMRNLDPEANHARRFHGLEEDDIPPNPTYDVIRDSWKIMLQYTTDAVSLTYANEEACDAETSVETIWRWLPTLVVGTEDYLRGMQCREQMSRLLALIIYQTTSAHYLWSLMVLPYYRYVSTRYYNGVRKGNSLPTNSGTRPLLRDYATEVGATGKYKELMDRFQTQMRELDKRLERGHEDWIPYPSEVHAAALY